MRFEENLIVVNKENVKYGNESYVFKDQLIQCMKEVLFSDQYIMQIIRALIKYIETKYRNNKQNFPF